VRWDVGDASFRARHFGANDSTRWEKMEFVMTPDDAEMMEKQFSMLLAASDEALARGQQPETALPADLPETLRRRLVQACTCLNALENLWPRSTERTPSFHPVAQQRTAGGMEETATPPCLGRFQIIRELGRGGYGIVYLAIDSRLGREVALKIPGPMALLTPELRQRFRREAELAASLDHPNIVPTFEAGEEGAITYIISAYCPGPSLARWLQERGQLVEPVFAAEMVARLAGAVQHAHDRGILHRDIKPSNVMIGSAADCQPRLTDFGLAKLECTPDQTRSGVFLGTPSYMAPEQAEAGHGAVGPATDVYALGAVLYEMLTGRPPYQGASVLQTLDEVRTNEPVPPGQLHGGLPRDLETICLKCLQKQTRNRYDSARALAEDLRRFLNNEPILARPVSVGQRLFKWIKRRPTAASLVCACVLGLIALVAGAAWHVSQLQQALSNTREAKKDAEERERQVRRFLYGFIRLSSG
jgi:hypothetical protein